MTVDEVVHQLDARCTREVVRLVEVHGRVPVRVPPEDVVARGRIKGAHALAESVYVAENGTEHTRLHFFKKLIG